MTNEDNEDYDPPPPPNLVTNPGAWLNDVGGTLLWWGFFGFIFFLIIVWNNSLDSKNNLKKRKEAEEAIIQNAIKDFSIRATTPEAIKNGHPNNIGITFRGKKHKLIGSRFTLGLTTQDGVHHEIKQVRSEWKPDEEIVIETSTKSPIEEFMLTGEATLNGKAVLLYYYGGRISD